MKIALGLGILVVVGFVLYALVKFIKGTVRVLGGMISWVREFRIVSARPGRIDELVGDTTMLFLRLEHKPRWRTTYDMVAGTFTVTAGGNGYTLDPAAGSLPAGGTLPEIEQVIGVSVGRGIVNVAGTAATGEIHTPADVPVVIYESWIDAFKAAAKAWYDPLWTGWVHNLFGKNCDDWNVWMQRWITKFGKGHVCKLEEVTFPKNLIGSHHVCIRVTMCPNGPVYYLDPWRFGPDAAAMGKDEYERLYGTPMPDGVIEIPM
jgi:hypothetical protein